MSIENFYGWYQNEKYKIRRSLWTIINTENMTPEIVVFKEKRNEKI